MRSAHCRLYKNIFFIIINRLFLQIYFFNRQQTIGIRTSISSFADNISFRYRWGNPKAPLAHLNVHAFKY